MKARNVRLSRPLDLRLTLGPLRHGAADPCVRFESDVFWRATRTPEGPATMLLRVRDMDLEGTAWGAGASWVLEHLPELVGEHQEDGEFTTSHPVVRDLHRRLSGLRICRSGAVIESLVPTIIEQRVTTREAVRSYRQIVRRFSEPAPGPVLTHRLMLPPNPDVLADIPYWALHPFGIERKRADALRAACRARVALECATGDSAERAQQLLMSVRGVGPWSAAEVALTALGDADAVLIGDYHLHNWVCWSLAGEPRGDDERMVELLEPFRGQRGRVIRLIAATGNAPPKYGPRYNPIPIAAL